MPPDSGLAARRPAAVAELQPARSARCSRCSHQRRLLPATARVNREHRRMVRDVGCPVPFQRTLRALRSAQRTELATRWATCAQRRARSTAFVAVVGETSSGSYSVLVFNGSSRRSSRSTSAPSGPAPASKARTWLWSSPAPRWPSRALHTASAALIPACTARLVAAMKREDLVCGQNLDEM